MRFVYNGSGWSEVTAAIPDSWKGPLYPLVDGIFTPITDRVGEWATAKLESLIATLNDHSADIITVGIVICAFGIMIAPLLESVPTSKWYGRLFAVLWLGVIWRVLI